MRSGDVKLVKCPGCGGFVAEGRECLRCRAFAEAEKKAQDGPALPSPPEKTEPASEKRPHRASTLTIIGAAIIGIFVIAIAIAAVSGSGKGSTAGYSPVVPIRDYDLGQFQSIQIGMSQSAVNSIMGDSGTEMGRNSIGEYETVMVSWQNDDGSNILVMFQNDRVIQKNQAGL